MPLLFKQVISPMNQLDAFASNRREKRTTYHCKRGSRLCYCSIVDEHKLRSLIEGDPCHAAVEQVMSCMDLLQNGWWCFDCSGLGFPEILLRAPCRSPITVQHFPLDASERVFHTISESRGSNPARADPCWKSHA